MFLGRLIRDMFKADATSKWTVFQSWLEQRSDRDSIFVREVLDPENQKGIFDSIVNKMKEVDDKVGI